MNAQRTLYGGMAFSLLFTALIWLLGSRLDSIALLPDQGAAWYKWNLPEPSALTRLSAWLPCCTRWPSGP